MLGDMGEEIQELEDSNGRLKVALVCAIGIIILLVIILIWR
jgi:hypothetical protein